METAYLHFSTLIIYSIIQLRLIFVLLFVFLIYNVVYFQDTVFYKKITTKEIKCFIFGNYYRQNRFIKGNSYLMKYWKKNDLLLLSTTFMKKIPDDSNVKEYYESLLKNNNKKLFKRSKIMTQRPVELKRLKFVTKLVLKFKKNRKWWWNKI